MKWKEIALPLVRNKRCKCGKISFDKKTAQTKRNDLLNRGNERFLRIYKCNRSNYWHLTKEEFKDFINDSECEE